MHCTKPFDIMTSAPPRNICIRYSTTVLYMDSIKAHAHTHFVLVKEMRASWTSVNGYIRWTVTERMDGFLILKRIQVK